LFIVFLSWSSAVNTYDRTLARDLADALKKNFEFLERSKQVLEDLQALIAKTDDLVKQAKGGDRSSPIPNNPSQYRVPNCGP
jgi:hypothetical protein